MVLKFLDITTNVHNVKAINAIVANELIKRGLLTEDNIPWGKGKRRYYISKTPKHQHGKEFFSPIRLSNGWWIETHASRKSTLDLVRRLMEHCGITNTQIELN
jgi:hypothetical protein